MLIYRKLVAVLLVLMIPTVSALALSVCPQMSEMGNVQPQMPMMDMTPVQLSFIASQTNLCCEISPAEIVPVPMRASRGNEPKVIAIAIVSPTQVSHCDRTTTYPEAQAVSPPTQARLCVLLI